MGSDQMQAAMDKAVHRLLSPKSIAIVGASADPTSMGARTLSAIGRFGFEGEVHLVNPKRSEIDGRPCVPTVADLPHGVDALILSSPQAAVDDAIWAAIANGVGGAVLFSAGYAETGPEGKAAQDRLAALARENGFALAGPNCLGLVNFRDGVPLTSGPVAPFGPKDKKGLAVLAQSGGMMGCLINASEARGLKLSYAISTGNEAVLSIEDYMGAMVADSETKAIAVFVEQLRHPQRFLDLSRKARDAGKPVILLHSGRSERSQQASLSHTGAVASNYAAMESAVKAAGVVLVDGMDELMDVSELFTTLETIPSHGAGIVTDSGAFKGLALDFAEAAGLPLPELTAATAEKLKAAIPDFAEASNPLDLTAQAMRSIETAYADTAVALESDPQIDCALMCILPGATHVLTAKTKAVAAVQDKVEAPVVCVVLGGGHPVPEEGRMALQAAGVPLSQSGERTIRALAKVIAYGAAMRQGRADAGAALATTPKLPGSGILPEYVGKAWLKETIGISIPEGALARNADEAAQIAGKLGYPVVMKVQHADLGHKSDVGGVVVGIADDAAARAAWATISANVAKHKPGLVFDGILVEKMGAKGVELVVGARRDPAWGPLVMVGLGGVWIELLKDVRLLPAEVSAKTVRAELDKLKAAKLLKGYRGAEPVDLDAVADLVARLGALMRACPDIAEVDINPVIAYPEGQGILALDALIVTGDPA